MSHTGLTAFDSTLQTTNIWLNEVMEEMGWQDRHRAYHALRAVLQTLRDRLTVEEATDLGAQLPMLVRGFYYDGYRPNDKPRKERKKEEFLAHIAQSFERDAEADPERVTRAVFHVLERHVTEGQIEDVKRSLPEDVRELWAKA